MMLLRFSSVRRPCAAFTIPILNRFKLVADEMEEDEKAARLFGICMDFAMELSTLFAVQRDIAENNK